MSDGRQNPTTTDVKTKHLIDVKMQRLDCNIVFFQHRAALVGTTNCLHYTIITYGYCHSKSIKYTLTGMLSHCSHQESRQVDSLTEASAAAVTGFALPLYAPTSLKTKTGIFRSDCLN